MLERRATFGAEETARLPKMNDNTSILVPYGHGVKKILWITRKIIDKQRLSYCAVPVRKKKKRVPSLPLK